MLNHFSLRRIFILVLLQVRQAIVGGHRLDVQFIGLNFLESLVHHTCDYLITFNESHYYYFTFTLFYVGRIKLSVQYTIFSVEMCSASLSGI